MICSRWAMRVIIDRRIATNSNAEAIAAYSLYKTFAFNALVQEIFNLSLKKVVIQDIIIMHQN